MCEGHVPTESRSVTSLDFPLRCQGSILAFVGDKACGRSGEKVLREQSQREAPELQFWDQEKRGRCSHLREVPVLQTLTRVGRLKMGSRFVSMLLFS